MNFNELETLDPDAALGWSDIAEYVLRGIIDDDEIEERVQSSYFYVSEDGGIIGDGITEFTQYIWYPGVSTTWRDVEDEE